MPRTDPPGAGMRGRIGRAFDRASRGYDSAAVLQTDVRDILLQRLAIARLEPATILDAGSGTGHASLKLKHRYPKARVVALDIAHQMLREAGRRQRFRRRFDRVRADAARLPFQDRTFDLVFSNLLLSWCDPDDVLREFRRVLRPGGLLTLSSYGPDTLRELRTAWSGVDDAAHVNLFIDMHDLGDACVRAGFAAPVLDVERYTLAYADVPALIRDLRAVGANTLIGPAGEAGTDAVVRRGLTGRRKFAAMQSAYEGLRREARLPASYEIVFANAWTPADAGGQRKTTGGTSADVHVSLEELSAELKARAARGGDRGTRGGGES